MRTQPAGSLKVQEHPRRKSSELTCSYKSMHQVIVLLGHREVMYSPLQKS